MASRDMLEPASGPVPVEARTLPIPLVSVDLVGDLVVPEDPIGLVAFAHGSGSSRSSPRNRAVAQTLNRARLATLLFDLLTVDEEADRTLVFDVELLAGRLVETTRWLRRQPPVRELRIGYFGASTGAAAALLAAAEIGDLVGAVVSRGGRPDLVGRDLGAVRAPTLLIVGARDQQVVELNRRAQALLTCESALEIVPGATHLFEEPGALDAVARMAESWFVGHLAPAGRMPVGEEGER